MKNIFLLFTFLASSFCIHAMEESEQSPRSPKSSRLSRSQKSPRSSRLFSSSKSPRSSQLFIPSDSPPPSSRKLQRSETAPQLRALGKVMELDLNPDKRDHKKNDHLSKRLKDTTRIPSNDILFREGTDADLQVKRTAHLEEIKLVLIALGVDPKKADLVKKVLKPFYTEFNFMRKELERISDQQEALDRKITIILNLLDPENYSASSDDGEESE